MKGDRSMENFVNIEETRQNKNVSMYDIEQAIMNCWQVVDDINILVKRIEDGIDCPSIEDITQVIKAISVLYELKFNALFNTYEEVLQLEKPRKCCESCKQGECK